VRLIVKSNAGWSLNGKFAIFTFENTADIEPALAIDLGKIDSETEEAAGQNKIERRIDGEILGWPSRQREMVASNHSGRSRMNYDL
jgi:hypothetical protein